MAIMLSRFIVYLCPYRDQIFLSSYKNLARYSWMGPLDISPVVKVNQKLADDIYMDANPKLSNPPATLSNCQLS